VNAKLQDDDRGQLARAAYETGVYASVDLLRRKYKCLPDSDSWAKIQLYLACNSLLWMIQAPIEEYWK
jgi:hypothetical protein